MTHFPKYDFTQHFITCGRWKKVFNGLARQIMNVWSVDDVEIESAEILHYSTVKQHYPKHKYLTPIIFSSEEDTVPCALLRDVDVPNKELIKACQDVFCCNFPLEISKDSEASSIHNETLCFVSEFQLPRSTLLLLVPCKPFKNWQNILETFSYTSNCKADISKDRLSARHIDLQKAEMNIKAYLRHSISPDDLQEGKVMMTTHTIDRPIHVGINESRNFEGTIGQSGGNRCVVLHEETI